MCHYLALPPVAAAVIWTVSQLYQSAKMEVTSLSNLLDATAASLHTTQAIFVHIEQTAQRVIASSAQAVFYFTYFFQFMFWLWMMFKVYLTSNLSVTRAIDSFGQFCMLALFVVLCSISFIARSNEELATVTEHYILPSTSIFWSFSTLYALCKSARALLLFSFNSFNIAPGAAYYNLYD